MLGCVAVSTLVSGCDTPSPIPPEALSARVISTECRGGDGRNRATVILENTGAEIRYSKLFLTYVGDGSVSVYGSPATIPPGARATFSFKRSSGPSSGCQIDRLQDNSGRQVRLD